MRIRVGSIDRPNRDTSKPSDGVADLIHEPGLVFLRDFPNSTSVSPKNCSALNRTGTDFDERTSYSDSTELAFLRLTD